MHLGRNEIVQLIFRQRKRFGDAAALAREAPVILGARQHMRRPAPMQ